MVRYQCTAFSQGDLLRIGSVPREARDGVCVALCDHWLAQIKGSPSAPPGDRLDQLRANFRRIVNHQIHYSNLRARQGREAARRSVGGMQGLVYDTEKTTLVRRCIGRAGIRQKLAEDIGRVGSAATWTLRFQDGRGHAIAGFCGIAGKEPILFYQLHVFDPNIGEYVGPWEALDEILSDLLTRFPLYETLIEVHRASEG